MLWQFSILVVSVIWNLDETSMIESQDFILNKIRDLGRAPKLIEFCGPDPGENEYELQDILVFVNGYRLGEPVEAYNLLALDDYLSQLERGQQPRFNNVFFADVMAYWNLNGQFKSRLKPETTLYVDGHNDISTSNHRTSAKFTASLLTSKAVDALVLHNDNPNDQGFVDRKNAGEIAGIAILDMILDGRIPTSRTGNKINQKIDIVAHSFGYAHALGLYQAIKETASVVDIEIDFGRFYILAPENAGTDSGEFMLTDFDQVWQYGSKRDRPNPLSGEDPASKQDGVAVQRGIKDLLEFGELEPNRNLYGRSFIPNDDDFPDKVDVPRGFLESHYESNYLWMFTHLDNEDQDGYINPK